MSGVLKAIGKVFSPITAIGKKGLKVLKKIALPAIMVGAVVLTGGAALGVLPALGTMVGGLGLSAGLTTVLTGAISTGAIGAVGGFLTGGMKGATKGFLMGAATGGLMGAAGMTGINGVLGGGKAVAGAASQAASGATGAVPTLASSGGLVQGTLASSLAGTVPEIGIQGVVGAGIPGVTMGGAAAGAATGISGLLQNPQLISSITGGLAAAFTPSPASEAARAETQARERNSYFAYGGGDPDGKKKKFGMVQGVYSGQPNAFGQSNYGTPPAIQTPYQPRAKRWVWDATQNAVVEVGAG